MKGTSYTYFTTDNAKSARELLAILREAKANIPPQLEEMSMFGGGGGRSTSECSICDVKYSRRFSTGRYGGGGGRGRGGGRGGGGGGYSGHQDSGYGSRGDRW